MEKRQLVTENFSVEDFIFEEKTCASVNDNKNYELIKQYIEDPKYLEEIEALISNCDDEDIPKGEDLMDENLDIYI